MAINFNKRGLGRLKLKLPGGTAGKYGKVGKIVAALGVGPVLGPVNPLAMDPEVLGARGSAQNYGLSVDEAKQQKLGDIKEMDAATAAQEQAKKAAEQQAIAERLAQEEEARKKLRAAATGGFASTVLSGPTGLTTFGAAGRRLYGS